jgi:opacity protein-like surface antigen
MKRLVTLLFAVVLTFLAGPASAEWIVDLYGGATYTHEADVSVKGDLSGVSGNVTLRDVEFDASFVVGARAGYWFGQPSFEGLSIFGIALDVWHYRPDANGGSIDAGGATVTLDDLAIQVTALSLDLMFRAPYLVSEEFPTGRLQIYVFGGPAVFLTIMEGGGISVNSVRRVDIDGSDIALGLKVGYGVTWLFTERIGGFAEYRFTHVSPEISEGGVRLKTDLNTHHLVAGLSLRF